MNGSRRSPNHPTMMNWREERDFYAEERARRRAEYFPLIALAVIVAVIVGMFLFVKGFDALTGTSCSGSQTVLVPQRGTLTSIIEANVNGINSVDTRDVIGMVITRDPAADGVLQIGQEITIPQSCSRGSTGWSS